MVMMGDVVDVGVADVGVVLVVVVDDDIRRMRTRR